MAGDLELEHVYKYFKGKTGGLSTALDNITIKFEQGKVHGIVGESGSGKSTLGRVSIGLVKPSKGIITINGKNISKMEDKEIFKLAQYIHQDPYSSLDQYLSVGEILDRPLMYLLNMKGKQERMEKVQDMLVSAGLGPEFYSRTIQELSGGEKQRVLVARAFMIEPELVIADEPTTMIDFVHRKEILDLIYNLSKMNQSTIIFISHDISIVEGISSDICVMYSGKIVESGSVSSIVEKPLHPYTQLLLSVSPEKLVNKNADFGPTSSNSIATSKIPVPVKKGCKYSSVCPFVFAKCREVEPELELSSGHLVACHQYN